MELLKKRYILIDVVGLIKLNVKDFQEKTELQEDHSEITDDNVLFRQPFLLSPNLVPI